MKNRVLAGGAITLSPHPSKANVQEKRVAGVAVIKPSSFFLNVINGWLWLYGCYDLYTPRIERILNIKMVIYRFGKLYFLCVVNPREYRPRDTQGAVTYNPGVRGSV